MNTLVDPLDETVDFKIEDHGSLVLVHPRTPWAGEWIDEYVDPTAQWWGDRLVVEPRYLEDLVVGMIEAGGRVA